MEYITVLKRPDYDCNMMEKGADVLSKLRKSDADAADDDKKHAWFSPRRLCSRVPFVLMLLVLMLVLFACQLVLYAQLQELKNRVRENTAKTDDLVESDLLDKFINKQRGHSEHKKNHLQRQLSRRDSNSAVYFRLRGAGESTSMGVFLWDQTHVRSGVNHLQPVLADGRTEKLKVQSTGLYYISVQIYVTGRRPMGAQFTPVGYWVCKATPNDHNRRVETLLGKAHTTQDGRGLILTRHGGYGQDPPVDSITFTDLVYLRAQDHIYVKKPDESRMDNTIKYDNSAEFAHFSGILLVRG